MKEFYIVNSKSEYYSGMMYGGEFMWCSDVNEAKIFDQDTKFTGLQRFCPTDELSQVYLAEELEVKPQVKKRPLSKDSLQKKVQTLRKKVDENPNSKVQLLGERVTAKQALEYYNKML